MHVEYSERFASPLNPPLAQRRGCFSQVRGPKPGQRFVLGPQAEADKGKKCLVLDLDETLVHSSFQVRAAITRTLSLRFTSRGTG